MSEGNTAPLARWKAGGAVNSIAVSRSGSRVAAGSRDNYARIWDVHTRALALEPLVGHNNWVRSVAFSPDDTHIVSGSDDCTIRIWDVRTGTPVGKPLKGHSNPVWSVASSHDGARIVSGSYDETIRIWDARTGTPIGKPLRGHKGRVRSVAFSHDSTCIVSGSVDNTIRLWDARTGNSIGKPLTHTDWVRSVAFSHDSTRIVSGSSDRAIRIWDARTGTLVGEPLKGHTDVVWSVAFSHDSTRIVSSSHDKTIRIWDVSTGTPMGEPLKGHTDAVYSVAFSPDSTHIFSGSVDGTIGVWQGPRDSPSSDTATSSQVYYSATLVPADILSPTTPAHQLPAAQVDETAASEEAPQEVPSFDMVSSSMSTQEMFDCLVKHGCTDFSASIDPARYSLSAIATGGFGDVWQAWLKDGILVAVKSLRLQMILDGDEKGMKRMARELYNWSKARHENIQELLGIVIFQERLGMVSLWMSNGNLQQYIEKNPDVDRHPLCIQLARGVAYLHGIGMIHGDLKAINVLVSVDGVLKISDFDYSILSDSTLRFSETTKAGGGTVRWMAPELLLKQDDGDGNGDGDEDGDREGGEIKPTVARNKQTDVYALGMTILETISGKVPYHQYKFDVGVIRALDRKQLPNRPRELSGPNERASRIWDLLRSCWDHDPSARPDASLVLGSLSI